MLRTNLLILFCVISLTFYTTLDNKNRTINLIEQKKIQINKIVDKATLDAIEGLNEGEGYAREVNKGRVLERFYNTLFLNLDIQADYIKQEQVKQCIPLMFLVDYAGVSTYAYTERLSNENIIEPVWHSEVAFSSMYGNYVVNYTVTDNVMVYNIVTNERYEDYYYNLKNLGISHFNSELEFNNEKNFVITKTITNEVNTQINNYNEFVGYNIMLPIDESNFVNTIKDVSFFVFASGIPINMDTTYNYYSFSGSRYYNPKEYYITQDVDGTMYYHTGDCEVVKNGGCRTVTNLDRELKLGVKPHSCNY